MDENFNPHQNRTLDGAPIVEGMKVWDYNLRVSTVLFDRDVDSTRCPRFCGQDHWFETTGGMFNGSRMWVAHPSTRVLAKDATGA